MKQTKLATAIKFAMGATAAMAVMPAANTFAADEKLEEVIVTGSRIKTDGFESASPVTVTTNVEISAAGITKIEDFLNSLPQISASDTSYESNGASGNATVDLRGLGADRTLVLINGRRMGPGGAYNSAAADINSIPSAMIDRVEVLTGGASTSYGADAVAGVVNFVMRKDFEGVEINARRSGYMHDNDNSYIQDLMDKRGFEYPKGGNGVDGEANDIEIVMGSGFADGKGHATVYATWHQDSELRQEARDYSSCALSGSGTSCGGSGNAIVPNFYIGPLDGGALDWGQVEYWTLGTDSSFIPSSGNVYNYAPVNHFMRPSEKWTFGTFMDYNVSDSLKLYAETMLMDYNTSAQIAESGTFFAEEYHLPYDSPLLNDTQRAQLTSTWGLQSGDEFGVYIGKRNVEGGARASVMGNNSYRIVLGAEGTLAGGWDYDVNYQKYRVNSRITYINDFFGPRITEALAAGEYDVFTYQGVTAEQASALTGVAMLSAAIDQEIFAATMTGDTGISLGATDKTVSVAMGFERRELNYDRDADTVFEDGMLLGQGGPTPSIAGGYNVTDIFVEAAIPLTDEITSELGYRYSDYSTSGGTDTYKAMLSWAPNDMFRVRTGYNRAIRSPSIGTMFAPQSQGLWSGSDPCAGATPDYTQEQCARTGVSAADYGNIIASPASQYNGLFGGSLDIKPEVADTVTFGVVVDPIENLTFSIDYWQVELTGAIGEVAPSIALEQCAINNNQTFCDLINRGNAGTLWLGTTGYVSGTSTNLGERNWTGVDIAAAYTMDVGPGTLNLKLIAAQQLKTEALILPGVEDTRYDCAGIADDENCAYANVDWKHTLSATYLIGDWSVVGRWRYIGEVDYQGDNDALAKDELGAVSYIDLSASWQMTENVEFSIGSRNLLDKEPPMVGGGMNPSNANTYSTYDVLGRYVFADVSLTF
jgi:outer membrane receptor protein involved in Fe transport